MNKELANIIKGKIAGLPFVDTLAGLVKTIEFSSLEPKEKGRIVKFPASVDSNTTPTDRPWQYADLVPNSKKKSVIYFEDRGLVISGKSKYGVAFESNLRLVVWLNLNNQLEAANALLATVQAIPEGEFNEAGLSRIKITPSKVLTINDKIFAEYSYQEAINQYLMFPFSAFAIDMKTTFNASGQC